MTYSTKMLWHESLATSASRRHSLKKSALLNPRSTASTRAPRSTQHWAPPNVRLPAGPQPSASTSKPSTSKLATKTSNSRPREENSTLSALLNPRLTARIIEISVQEGARVQLVEVALRVTQASPEAWFCTKTTTVLRTARWNLKKTKRSDSSTSKRIRNAETKRAMQLFNRKKRPSLSIFSTA